MRNKQVRTPRPLMAVAFPDAGNATLCRCGCRWSSFDRNQKLGVFCLDARKSVSAIETHSCGKCATLQILDQRSAPSQRARGIAKRAEGMADIELTIAERALAIFPGFPPLHR